MMHTTLSSSSSLDGDSLSHSSASTAGPPPDSPKNTGRFPRNAWHLATAQQYGSENEDVLTGSSTSRNLNQTGSYKPGRFSPSSVEGSAAHNRSLSNTTCSVSPMGSYAQPEWGRSFRLFNLRQTSNGRPRDSNNIYRSVFQSRGSFVAETDKGNFYNSSFHHRQNSAFGSTFNNFGYQHAAYPPDLRGSTLFSAGTPLPNSSMIYQQPSMNLSATHVSTSGASLPRPGGHSGPNAGLVEYVLGEDQDVYTSLSPQQKELNLSLAFLQSYLGVNGKTIIVGDEQRPLEIKRGPLIGSGGFAQVYVGLNTVKGDLVAIKEVNIADIDNVSALNAVEEEFALLRSISHPNIINYFFFEHSRSKKVCRIVMELLAGDSTFNLLQKFGPLTETILRKLTRDLLDAITFIHKEGIFHRDIKPANILVSHKGTVKLCDFGCSKRVEEMSKASSCIIGTPIYMAPELIKGEADHKADIWSMACTLFELGTGLLPWYHSGVKDNLPLMFYITTTSETPLVFPAQDNVNEFTPEFMDFLEQCFIRDPVKRPEAAELLKHPWINGQTLPPKVKHSALLSYVNNDLGFFTKNSVNKSSELDVNRPNEYESSISSKTTVDNNINTVSLDEAACQQELEVVAATIAVDLCNSLMSSGETFTRQMEQKSNDHSHSNSSPLNRTHSVSSPSVFRGPSGGGGTVSVSMGDIGSLNLSPETSLVHEGFCYPQAAMNMSGTNFVFPADYSVYNAPQSQQYLRINDEGNLEFFTVAEEDNETAFTEAFNFKSTSVDSSLLATSNQLSPARNSSFSRGSFTPGGLSSNVHAGERTATPQRMTPGYLSRCESPYRSGAFNARAFVRNVSHSPTLSAVGGNGSPRLSRTASLSSSPREERSPGTPMSISQRSSFAQSLPAKAKPNAEGKLNMSFCVNTAPGREISVELNVDVNDVQCKMIDSQPNYVVAMTDDIKGQITNKLKEVSSQSSHNTTVFQGNRSMGSGVHQEFQRSSTGSHFFNTPTWNSASKPNSSINRARYSTGGIGYHSPQLPYDSNSSYASRCSTPMGSASGTPHISPRTTKKK